jgi:hypothetical protein
MRATTTTRRIRLLVMSLTLTLVTGCLSLIEINWDQIFGPNSCDGCKAHFDEKISFAGGITGMSENVVYGSDCTEGYRRVQARAFKMEGGAGAACSDTGTDPRRGTPLGWVDQNPESCRFRVHFGLAPLTGLKCRVIIAERKK